MKDHSQSERGELVEEIHRKEAEIERLRVALRPFGGAADDFDWEECDDDHPQEVPVGWLRAARRALRGE